MFQAIEIHGLGKDGKISQQEVRGKRNPRTKGLKINLKLTKNRVKLKEINPNYKKSTSFKKKF